jgi:hypothetical protein
MIFAEIIIVLAVVVGVAIGISEVRKQRVEQAEGIFRYGGCTLDGKTIVVGGEQHPITRETSAEVVGSVSQGRRSTATRTAAGAVVAGIPGALVGHAAKKKTRSSNAMLLLDGLDWSEMIPVGPTSYGEAVRFAQQVNLAARQSSRKRRGR